MPSNRKRGSPDSSVLPVEAVRLFLDEAGRMGTLDRILEEASYTAVPVFAIRNNLRTAGMTRKRCPELLQG
jgi:hypothetical protein